MVLHLTKTLAEKLNCKPGEEHVTDSFLSWRAHYVQAHRQRFVVFMNDASRFTVVLNKANAAALKKLPELFINNLRETLLVLGVNPDVINAYIAELGDIHYAKNSDRKRTAQLNKNTEAVWHSFSREYNNDADLAKFANCYPYGISTPEETIVPNKKIFELLSRYGMPILKFRAIDIHVKLFLGDGKKSAVRYLRIPLNITFVQLHKVIQAAFGWQNYHLYSFGLFKEWPRDYYNARPDIELMDRTETYDIRPYEKEIAGTRLPDYVPEYRKVLYRYDYGDNWEHYIEFGNITEDCDEDLPKLLFGEGDAPPEDSGGIGGFAEFQEIISDPTNEEYKELTAWAASQRWKPFDFEVSARKVKYSLTPW